MANFQKALEITLKHEGGFTIDQGGKTKFGISQNANPGIDIENLTIAQAGDIYKKKYWNPIQADLIKSEKLAQVYFDMAVNLGTGQATKLLQRVLNMNGAKLAVDGGMGPGTLAAMNKLGNSIADSLILERIKFYNNLVAMDPQKYSSSLKGWLKRANSFFDDGRAMITGKANKSIMIPIAISAALVGAWWITKRMRG